MKLRILDDSVRLRLARGEVERLGAGETVAARCGFPDGSELVYCLGAGAAAAAALRDGRLEVTLPAAELQHWCRDAVSWKAELDLAGGRTLTLLVEKDFQCLAPREGEDESDLYPHPDATAE